MTALVETKELEPGLTAVQITSLHGPDPVQAEIDRIMDGVECGSAEFRLPRREYSMQDGLMAWRSRGYVREACRDLQKYMDAKREAQS